MGCLWSSEGPENCKHCHRRPVNNLVIIDNVCEICIHRATRGQHSQTPKYGEFSCGACGRYWNSRFCWPDKYQMCKLCHKPTLPYQYRDLRATDMTSSDDGQEHIQELCQMCQQLGHSCKRFGKNNAAPRKSNVRQKRSYKN